ncbi:MAG: prepilin-type N-terminal cleavage/methylation domain-containing protein [Puniceicoccales bacterium]|jgi:prepilin-type N-terminal cleavage/methylation domain-containing protein|nr:prepilin-type N-terminal cleavage/methylation domain-containing protein [Puniceicoccales bacterium]
MNSRSKGFSLLELIIVLVIMLIIAGLVLAGISTHKHAALVAKTKIQFLEYEAAINAYCREYGDLPPFFRDEELVSLRDSNNSEMFVKILSGQNVDGKPLSANEKKLLNPKGKAFHRFANEEFFMAPDGTRDRKILVDAFNNRNISLIVEDPFDEDTIISKSKFPANIRKYIKGEGVKSAVVIFSESDDGRMIISNSFDNLGLL